jgi:hypothetical protein
MKQDKGIHTNQEYWSSVLISILWKFTTQMWANWNQVVHGQTAEEQADVILTRLHGKVQDYYNSFQEDSAYVL